MEFTIDCGTCPRYQHEPGSPAVADGEACEDCIVAFIAGREPGEAVVVPAEEFAALRRLAAAGLIDRPGRNEVEDAS